MICLLPAAVPGVLGPMQRQVDFLSSGGQCRSSSVGFDWRDVSQVAVPFTCGFFSSAGKFYQSSSVFRGSGPGFSSAHFWSLLHWRRLSVVLPASTVDCCLSSLRAGVCSLMWQWQISSPSGGGDGSVSCTLDAYCIDRFPVNHGLF